jgi:hypothetical protein
VNTEITIIGADGITYKMVPMVEIPAKGDTFNMRWQDESTPGQLVQAHVAGIVVAITWTAPYAVSVKLE